MKSEKLISNLRDFFQQRGFNKAVVGLSGGVDSSLTLAIAAKALGAENVFGLILPQAGVSSAESRELALKVAEKFGVKTFEFELGKVLEQLKFEWEENKLAKINLAPRVRMIALYHFANSQNALVLGTSNKSEILLGYGTKFGDFAGDVEVLGSLWKTEVWEMAKELEIPEEIISRPPSAELWESQTDEEELGGSYAQVDEILKKLEANDFELGEDANDLEKSILQRVTENKHKTDLPPVLNKD